ncbi:PepSY domain-containing protein [Vreelandella rituensis]|uniref:PepSY domain-containing protein n=1 Tax=Vreelandella rituensis TaxID=2282306 RepID=A0A368TRK3_9GAMM|nr:PepSY domain-containing protein [Halomonas rituensis]RCV87230.1 PepSY domain-containing protein [Halomonas rituensis]
MPSNMINITTATLLLTASTAALAETHCTDAPRDEWISQADMQERIRDMGYEIKEFKVTDGNCYEIYGWDEQDRRVEIYFNPVDASIVKKEIED